VLDRELDHHRDYAPLLKGVDLPAVMAFVRPLMAERPLTGPQLRAALATRFPEHAAAALAYACRNLLAVVQVPPRGLWRGSGQVTLTTVDAWLGRPVASKPSIDEVVMRYLGAFGPAAVADVAAWSGLTGLREVVDRIRPRLREFRDQRGRELVDLPDAPRPDPDMPSPPRFLPEYDNLVLSHADRTRVISEEHRTVLYRVDAPVQGSVLYDGFVRGTWSTESDAESGSVTLTIRHVGTLAKRASDSIAAEGRRVLGFVEADAPGHDVRVERIE
jgi:hypothetical protein